MGDSSVKPWHLFEAMVFMAVISVFILISSKHCHESLMCII